MSFENISLGKTSIEIIDGDRGKNYPKQNEFTEKGYCLFLSAKNVTTEGFEFSEKNFISAEKDSLLRKGKLQRNDIVLTTRGTVGNVAYYHNRVYYNNIRINSGMVILRVNKNEFFPDFVYWLFRSSLIQNQIKSIKTGSAQPQLPIMIMKNLTLIKPELDSQQKIASILSTLDDKIELNNRMNKVLEQMAQAIFKQWFVDFEFPNENGEPYKSSGGEMEWCEELGKEIPKGWRIGCLADIAEILMGQSPKSEFYNTTGEGLPFHQGVANYGYRYPVHNVFCSHLLRVARKGSILMSVRAPVGRLNIADRDIVIGRGLCAITPKHNYYSYLFALLQTVFAVEDRYGSGTIFNSISKKELENIKIIIPTMELMRLFDEVASSYDSKISNNCNQISLLSQTRDTLLPKLMSGEIDVSEIEL
ncbi:restriction endonuclease subunit S [Paenibacillus sp. 3LSP]|uniref:restriction endonuclease subunit S n=1 Tax=Paenibacillus sp. 3LSP TaxID=2800795 RepID=UPI0028FD9E50|nr:restriction endonuclease subunit S [Paenibacillus sp. 3LSP]MDU0331046.1 restriction endonuclease subunit S [Paenibacillus sp. 3LSP]